VHKLIMVTGSGPGAGKSTMTEFLAEQLAAQGVPVRCLREDDVAHLDAFAPLHESFRQGAPDAADALLAASGNLVRESAAPRVHLVDALLPGYHYLFGLYPAWRIASYNLDLYKALCSMRPMIVYLKSDIDSAFRRAVKERGQEWLGEFLKRINGHYQTAQHMRTSLPLSSIGDVVSFFEEMDQLMLRMVGEWAGKSLVVETQGRTVDQVKMMLRRCNS
jgi:tRNA uridine 5-carbamoylmethylation protein Kti12